MITSPLRNTCVIVCVYAITIVDDVCLAACIKQLMADDFVFDEQQQDLFSEFGNILKHAVHYDKSGRSMGIAEVTFSSRNDALRAKAKYNNVPLDGRPMQIAVEGSPAGGAGGNAEPGSMKSRIGQRSPRVSSVRASPRGGVRGVARAGKRGGSAAVPRSGTGWVPEEKIESGQFCLKNLLLTVIFYFPKQSWR